MMLIINFQNGGHYNYKLIIKCSFVLPSKIRFTFIKSAKFLIKVQFECPFSPEPQHPFPVSVCWSWICEPAFSNLGFKFQLCDVPVWFWVYYSFQFWVWNPFGDITMSISLCLHSQWFSCFFWVMLLGYRLFIFNSSSPVFSVSSLELCVVLFSSWLILVVACLVCVCSP